jgi:hypothetical protein
MAKGGKLAKTEVVPVRFDPVTKWAVELAAAVERRTMASMVEYVVARAMQDWPLTTQGDTSISAMQIAKECWATEHPSRLMALCGRYPHLLTYEEQQICNSAHVALQYDAPHQVSTVFEDVLLEAVWPFVLQHAEGKIDSSRLWLESRKAAAWLIEDSGGNVATLLRGLARGELAPADFASRLTADPRAKEQLLNILGES